MSKKKLVRLSIFFIPIIFIFSQCLNTKKDGDPRGSAYAGPATCVSCHKDIYNSYLHTAHFMASQPASAQTIQGSFSKGSNEFVFNPHLKVVMNKRDTGYYQTSYADGRLDQSQRFDISFGGVKGQTYGYWFTNELLQLPISYVDQTHEWINSPGYEPNRVAFDRIMGAQCLGCHLSYAKPQKPLLPDFFIRAEGFEKNSLVYSVDCERCHGPGAEHVKFQTENPNEKTAKFIATFKSLTREQKINMCAVCHSGSNNHLFKPTFGFKPGDTLDNYMKVISNNAPVNYKNIDVHGNQRGLLESSKCFISSNMDCATCHNTHVNERGNTLIYTARCMTCHNSDSHIQCKLTNQLSAAALTNNCIACHMPAFASKVIITGQSATLVHTHHIAIYPEEAQKVLLLLKGKPAAKSSSLN
jgi:hypothetical protein